MTCNVFGRTLNLAQHQQHWVGLELDVSTKYNLFTQWRPQTCTRLLLTLT